MPNITGLEDAKATTDLDLNFKQLLNFSPSQIFPNSGYSGYSGYCGTSGYSGFCGKSGFSGFSGTVSQDPVVRHIVATTGTTPTATLGPAAGTGATIAVLSGSTDTAGRCTLIIGSSPSTSAGDVVCRVTFGNVFANKPIVVIGSDAGGASQMHFATYLNISTTYFEIVLSGWGTIPTVGPYVGVMQEFYNNSFSWIAIGK